MPVLAWEARNTFTTSGGSVGIREHDKSMGPVITVLTKFRMGDPGGCRWVRQTQIRSKKNFTPNFPACRGHATFGAAALHITRLFYNVSVSDKKT